MANPAFAQHIERTAECCTEFAPESFAFRLIPTCSFFGFQNGFFEQRKKNGKKKEPESFTRRAVPTNASLDECSPVIRRLTTIFAWATHAASRRRSAGAGGVANLLELAIVAARVRATVGEISNAMEAVFGRHQAEIRSVSGIYGSAYEGDNEFAAIRGEVEAFAREEGRRPHIPRRQDGAGRPRPRRQDHRHRLHRSRLRLGPLFQTPEEVVKDAIEADVHVIGISSLAAGHQTLVPQLMEALKREGAGEILVVAGGVIPPQDYAALEGAGVAAIFGPGTNIPAAARSVLELIRARRVGEAVE
jgi:methylmalonyl-CoA mutase cobalamin-binding domain/chain